MPVDEAPPAWAHDDAAVASTVSASSANLATPDDLHRWTRLNSYSVSIPVGDHAWQVLGQLGRTGGLQILQQVLQRRNRRNIQFQLIPHVLHGRPGHVRATFAGFLLPVECDGHAAGGRSEEHT